MAEEKDRQDAGRPNRPNRPTSPAGPGSSARPASDTGAPDVGAAEAAPPAQRRGPDLARAALRAAREQARERGARVGQDDRSRRRTVRSTARPDGRDPFPLRAALERLTAERGWEVSVAVGGVTGRWSEIVGPDIAEHCVPEHFAEEERVLTVRCDSTTWATQLRLLAPRLVRRLNEDLGHGTVKLITVLGPAGPKRRYGKLRAPGSRGPGDTWG